MEHGGFKPGKPGHLYFLAHTGYRALKVGITNVDTDRLASFQLAGWEVRHLEIFPHGADAAEVERLIMRWWGRELGLAPWCTPDQMARTGGWDRDGRRTSGRSGGLHCAQFGLSGR